MQKGVTYRAKIIVSIPQRELDCHRAVSKSIYQKNEQIGYFIFSIKMCSEFVHSRVKKVEKNVFATRCWTKDPYLKLFLCKVVCFLLTKH